MQPFDLRGPLPGEPLDDRAGGQRRHRQDLHASAALVTRYVAEGAATLDEMLVVTFGRAASQELRERVREPARARRTGLRRSRAWPAGQRPVHRPARRRHRRRAGRTPATGCAIALADFDAATIATTHQFCQSGAEIPRRRRRQRRRRRRWSRASTIWSSRSSTTSTSRASAGKRERPPDHPGRRAASWPARWSTTRGTGCNRWTPRPGLRAAVRVGFANDVLRRGRPAQAPARHPRLRRPAQPAGRRAGRPDAPARDRMRPRWSVVLVDEFQDTDPVQWQVIERAFGGHSTLILIGDPKQAIYAFRGGDIVTYLAAARTAGQRHTLGDNWRSDAPLVDRLQVVLGGAELGDPDIWSSTSNAHHRGHRLAGAPHNDPFRLRVVRREAVRRAEPATSRWTTLRPHIAADLAADIAALLAASHLRRRAVAGPRHRRHRREPRRRPRLFRRARGRGRSRRLHRRHRRVQSQAADDWLGLLEAFDQPHRPGLVRAAATTMFFGKTAEDLAAGGDELTDQIADTLRQWADHARERGVAAMFEAAQLAGMGRRVLSWAGGERHMTDLAHVAQLLQDVAHRERLQPARLARLAAHPARRTQRCPGTQPPPGQRRRGRADHDGVGQQGPAVPDRVPAVHVQSLCAQRGSGALPRRGPALPARRRRPEQPSW